MLRSIRFSIAHSLGEEEVDLQNRTIMFEISDGSQWSAPAFATITILPHNDNSPIITLTPSGEVCRHLLQFCCLFILFFFHTQPFVEGSNSSVQLLDDVYLTDLDHQQYITQAQVNTMFLSLSLSCHPSCGSCYIYSQSNE